MARISYVDNDFKYVRAYINRSYTELAEDIKGHLEDLDYYFENNGKLYGYYMTKNSLLSKVYDDDFFVVHFCFVDIDTLHDEEQEECIKKLLNNLVSDMNNKRGYYNLKIPAHIVDLVRAYNYLSEPFIFCGGTVEEYIYGKNAPESNKSNLNISMVDGEYVEMHYDELLEMTYRSFETYQGQYHLSYAISDKAPDIYKEWIKSSLVPQSSDKVIVAELEGKPIGFVTIGQDDFSVVGILSAVASEYRQYGAYKAMIAYIINYANSIGKSFITGTQFDNLIVQGTWNSLGLKPFYSFYNIHLDKR